MKVHDLFENDWENDPIQDKDYIRKLKQKMYGIDQEIEVLQGELRDWETGAEKQVEPKRMQHIQKKINMLQTQRQMINDKRLKALKNFKTFVHDPESAYRYAVSIRKGPFPEGEPGIAKHGPYAMEYALNLLNKRFPAGEEAMRDNNVDQDKRDEYERRFGVNVNPRYF